MMGPRIEWLPPEEVENFVSPWMTEKPKFQDARVMIAEKLFDSKDESLFIYQIDLDNGIRLIFDANKEFIHRVYG